MEKKKWAIKISENNFCVAFSLCKGFEYERRTDLTKILY